MYSEEQPEQTNSEQTLEKAYKIKKQITEMKKQVRDLEDEYFMLVQKAIREETFQEGDYLLVPNKRRSSEIRAQEFITRFPDIAKFVAKIPIGKTEKLLALEGLSLSDIQDIIDVNVETTYKIIRT